MLGSGFQEMRIARHLRVLKRPLPCEQLFANEAFSSILTHNTENFSNALILSCAPVLFPSLVMTHFSAPYGTSLMRLCRIPQAALFTGSICDGQNELLLMQAAHR